jgi:hypothetical protein
VSSAHNGKQYWNSDSIFARRAIETCPFVLRAYPTPTQYYEKRLPPAGPASKSSFDTISLTDVLSAAFSAGSAQTVVLRQQNYRADPVFQAYPASMPQRMR